MNMRANSGLREPLSTAIGYLMTASAASGNGTVLTLRKLTEHYDPTDRLGAMSYLQERQAHGEIVTGLLYVDPEASDLHDGLETVDTPLNVLGDAELTPGSGALEALNASLR